MNLPLLTIQIPHSHTGDIGHAARAAIMSVLHSERSPFHGIPFEVRFVPFESNEAMLLCMPKIRGLGPHRLGWIGTAVKVAFRRVVLDAATRDTGLHAAAKRGWAAQ